MATPDVHSTTFQQLDRLLTQYRDYWQFQPFHHREGCHWHPELHAALHNLSDNALHTIASHPEERNRFLAAWIDTETLASFCTLPAASFTPEDTLPHLATHIPGRKWTQITHFAQAVNAQHPILEWCAGKGHLGRLLAAQGAPSVDSLEWQENLCEQGTQLSQRAKLHHHHFHPVDAFSHDARELLQPHQHAIALHACGDLHGQLVTHVVDCKTAQLSFSPCCYHLISDDYYRPFSVLGKRSQLALSKADLSMTLRESVTAGHRERQQRQQELLWRIAFDEWQRDHFSDQYLPLPTIPKAILKTDLLHFIHWACTQKKRPPPRSIDEARYETQAHQRIRIIREMELVQHLFQRPLEIWLALDKMLYLQQHGYQTTLKTFCQKQITPRNLLIQATLNG